MPTVTELQIERAVEGKLSLSRPVPPRPARPVRFDPMLVEATPEGRRRRKILVGASVVSHVLLVIGVMLMPRRSLTMPEPSLPIQIVFTTPPPRIEEAAKPLPVPRPARRPPPAAPVPAKVPAPRPEPEVSHPPSAAAVPAPRVRPVVRTGVLGEINDAPLIVASRTGRTVVAQATGFDSSFVASPSARGERRVGAAAFDGPQATGSGRSKAQGSVREVAFDGGAAPAEAPRKRERAAASLDVDVEIVAKPKPAYTDEARRLGIEGDVVLEVTFVASGILEVLGVVEGLGHGLDEAAIHAARKIRFTPARRNGIPVDHTATLRVVFRLA